MERLQCRTGVVQALAVWCVLVAACAPALAQAQEQSVRGVVQRVVYQRVQVKTTAGRIYDAEVSSALLQRKNGLPMELSELRTGDVVEMAGSVWPDSSMTVARLRNVSLYPHSATLTGKVLAVDVAASRVRFRTSAYGEHVAEVGTGTVIQVKDAPPAVQYIAPGMTVTVKGSWERDRSVVMARSMRVTYRLLSVRVMGSVVGQVGTDLTVVADGVLYAVHAAGMAVQGLPSGQPLAWLVGRTVRVEAKHVAESLDLQPTRIQVVK